MATRKLIGVLAIVLLYWDCVFRINAGDIIGSRLLLWEHADLNTFFISGEESSQNFTDDSLDIEEGCRCLHGRCEKLCVKEKDGVCRKTANVCVCDPEFGKVNDETCAYCDCGKGFNCTFYHVSRKCDCPEGFYIRDDKCAEMCTDKLPCHNGGVCKKGKCECKENTSGPFCESSSWCRAKCNQPLLVDCVYNQDETNFDCHCKDRSLVYDIEERVCKPCSCGKGICIYKEDKLTCDCNSGYYVFQQQCRPCDCGADSTCLITKTGEKKCSCKDGYFSRNGLCLSCDCRHNDSKCELDKNGRKRCICPYGYEDILGQCIKMNKGDRVCKCHPTAICVKTSDENNEFNCTCKEGYKGKIHDVPLVGEECIDINECDDSEICSQSDATECFNFEGSYMCRCKTHYEPVDISADSRKTECKKYKVSWAPTGIVIGITVTLLAISAGVLLYPKTRSKLFSSTSGIELQYADHRT